MIRRIEDRFGVIDCNEPINHSYCDVDKRYYSIDLFSRITYSN